MICAFLCYFNYVVSGWYMTYMAYSRHGIHVASWRSCERAMYIQFRSCVHCVSIKKKIYRPQKRIQNPFKHLLKSSIWQSDEYYSGPVEILYSLAFWGQKQSSGGILLKRYSRNFSKYLCQSLFLNEVAGLSKKTPRFFKLDNFININQNIPILKCIFFL